MTHIIYCHGVALPGRYQTLAEVAGEAHTHVRDGCVRGPLTDLRAIHWDNYEPATWNSLPERAWVAVIYAGHPGSPEYVDHNHVIALERRCANSDDVCPPFVLETAAGDVTSLDAGGTPTDEKRRTRDHERPWLTHDSVDAMLRELELTRDDLGEALEGHLRRIAEMRETQPPLVRVSGRWWRLLGGRWVEGDVELSGEAATSATREATRHLSIADDFAENERVRREFADAVRDREAAEAWERSVNRKIDVESDDDDRESEETER